MAKPVTRFRSRATSHWHQATRLSLVLSGQLQLVDRKAGL